MAQLNIVHFDHQRDLSRDELEAAKSIYLIVNITINNIAHDRPSRRPGPGRPRRRTRCQGRAPPGA